MTSSPSLRHRHRRRGFVHAWLGLGDDLPLLCSCADGVACRGDCRR